MTQDTTEQNLDLIDVHAPTPESVRNRLLTAGGCLAAAAAFTMREAASRALSVNGRGAVETRLGADYPDLLLAALAGGVLLSCATSLAKLSRAAAPRTATAPLWALLVALATWTAWTVHEALPRVATVTT